MAPRLVAIQRLMAEHGVIFASISDIELGRLLMVMDEIFDERNRIAVITWRGSPNNNPSRVAIEHEYIAVYAKNVKKVPNKDSADRLGRYTDLDPDRGPYQVAYRVHNPKKGG